MPEGPEAVTARAALPRSARPGGYFYMVALAVACGLAGAAGAVLFRFMIRFVQTLFYEGPGALEQLLQSGLLVDPSDPLEVVRDLPWTLRIAIPALGGLVVGPLIYFLAREAKGHGVPEVMAAVALRGGVIRRRVVTIKALASAISIGSGGSVGREGPIIQIGSAMGSALGQLLRVPAAQLRTLVGCGAAAGIAATFNAPIAGALFAAEVIIANFAVAQLAPIVISSVVATAVSRAVLGNHPAFPVPTYDLVSPLELAPYMGVGLVAGLVALLFMRALSVGEDFFERTPIPEWARAGVGGALVGVIGLAWPEVHGVGYDSIAAALTGELPWILLGCLVLAKIVATSVTIGSGGSGGVFAPSLFLGAMTGGFCGTFIHAWFPEATASSGAYALVTMGAVVSATTHAPISSMIIIFEMTQSLDVIPPLMAACVVSTLVATYLQRDSIYTMKLRRRGIDLRAEEPSNLLEALRVRDVVDRRPELLRATAPLREIVDRILASDHTEFFVVNERDQLVGVIHLREMMRMLVEREALASIVIAGDLCEPRPPTVLEEDDLGLVMRLFSETRNDEIAVVDPEVQTLVKGSVHKKDVIQAYNQEVLRRDMAGGVSSTLLVAGKGQQVALGGGYVLQEVLPPARFFGHSIRDLDLGHVTGVHVVLLRKRAASDGRPAIRVPSADDVIEEGDRLVVSGTRSAVESLDAL